MPPIYCYECPFLKDDLSDEARLQDHQNNLIIFHFDGLVQEDITPLLANWS